MKKRIISVLLATVFALSVIGCGTKDTKEQDAYRQYGITCMESGKYEDAVKAFQNALGESIGHIGEKELDICFYKAKAQALDGKTKDALATYNAIIKYNKDARAYYLRGDLYMDMGEEKKGRADFESAVQQGKKNYEIYIGIYESLSRHEKKDEGQKYLSAAMEIKGDKPEDELYKGRISYLLGENKDAISYLEKAKEHKQMLASYYLGLAYDANGDSDKAKKCIAEYIKSGVATSYDLYELGMQEMQDGNYKNALTYFNSGLELEKVPNKQNLMKSAIAAYEYSGDFDSAKKMMKEYLKAYPDDEEELYVKRVIGLPGEEVRIDDGKIYIDGSETPLEEDYLKEEWTVATGPYLFEVPDDCYLVLGDNRNDSWDARYWDNKYVSIDKILGKGEVIYWPLQDIGKIR